MRSATLRLAETDREHLALAAAVLGVEVTPEAVRDFARFADMLELWSRRVNLLSCGSSRELIDRHFLDSLAAGALLPPGGLTVDLGSGAGFPGVPLAIVRRDRRFVLVESRQRRASFLAEVRRTLGLGNIEVLRGRAESPPDRFAHTATAVVSRAVWPDERLLEAAAEWLADDGVVLRMRGENGASVENVSFRLQRTVGYRIGRDRGRAVDVIIRSKCFT